MDDDIMSVRLSSFGFVIKRRSLLYSILVCLVGLLTYHVGYKEIVESDHGHLYSLVGIDYKPIDHELYWSKFQEEFSEEKATAKHYQMAQIFKDKYYAKVV